MRRPKTCAAASAARVRGPFAAPSIATRLAQSTPARIASKNAPSTLAVSVRRATGARSGRHASSAAAAAVTSSQPHRACAPRATSGVVGQPDGGPHDPVRQLPGPPPRAAAVPLYAVQPVVVQPRDRTPAHATVPAAAAPRRTLRQLRPTPARVRECAVCLLSALVLQPRPHRAPGRGVPASALPRPVQRVWLGHGAVGRPALRPLRCLLVSARRRPARAPRPARHATPVSAPRLRDRHAAPEPRVVLAALYGRLAPVRAPVALASGDRGVRCGRRRAAGVACRYRGCRGFRDVRVGGPIADAVPLKQQPPVASIR